VPWEAPRSINTLATIVYDWGPISTTLGDIRVKSASVGTELEELREREEFYRAMFEVNTAIKLLIDPADGLIMDANPAAEAFYGWTLAELRRMNIASINVLSAQELHLELERARTQQSSAFHFRHRTASGAIRDVDVYSGPVTLRGRVLLLSIIHDVSARVALEEQLQRAQRLDAIGQLAAGVAHDFNNLLAIALASVERAERKLPADHEIRGDLADVKRSVQQGATLTRQMLAFARQQALSPQLTDVAALIRRVVEMLQRVLGSHITIGAQLAANLPEIRVDPGQLELAFINLALNARDAMATGGSLVIRAFIEGPNLHMIVDDTGQGMDAETRARAFEPFFSTKPPGVGTGLGLATVYGLISQSDGKVWIDSAPDAGTHVHLLLPLDRPAQPARHELRRTTTQSASTVLIVDDRPDVRGALENALEVIGLAVYTAGSAAGALAVLDELSGAVDVVLSDVSMPDRSGLELAGDVRARWPMLPVVLMSGNVAEHESQTVAAWIEKPFTLDDIVAVLDRVTAS
jgi:two-component system cell cycle sensor histidine kinase/response regulator CckA